MGLQKLYYANSLRNLITKISHICPKFPTLGTMREVFPSSYNTQIFTQVFLHQFTYPSVLTPIHILFKVLQKF